MMRLPVAVGLAAITLAACTDAPVGPRQPMRAPTVQLSHLGDDPATADLCDGLSPCDAYDYRQDGTPTGAPGICFLSPMVDNHLSDPACSAPNQPGLGGIFKLAWCRVIYTDPSGETPPEIAQRQEQGTMVDDCQAPADWQPLVEGNGHYTASVQWKRSDAKVGDVFRLYVVRGERMFAHRDVVIDPNLTTPADDYVHAIGFGTEPVKLRINEDFSCIKYDTQEGTPENAATCLIAGETTVEFDTEELEVTFNFPNGNDPFLADFEVSECLSLGFGIDPVTGELTANALVDTPLADCKLSLSSEEVVVLDVPAQLIVTLTDGRWSDEPGAEGPFARARLNVLEYDEFGVGVLPPAADPGWLGGLAVSSRPALRWLGRGLDMLASLVLPEKAYAALGTGAGWNVARMSDLQISVMPVMQAASPGTDCASGDDFCTDLGTLPTGSAEPVSVHVTAPRDDMRNPDPSDYFDVPDTRLHFFPETGSVSCPGGVTSQDGYGRGCVMPADDDDSTDPPSHWDHVVVVTDMDGLGSALWTPDLGDNVLHVAACGVARPGDRKPTTLGDNNEWGDLGDCSNRRAAMTLVDYDNGAAPGLAPFEPVDILHEHAIYAPPLEFRAWGTCPDIHVDGMRGEAEWLASCADSVVFTAPVKGPKVSDNAKLFWYNNGDSLFLAVEVASTEIGSKMFIQLTESVDTDGIEAPGDEILVLDELGAGEGGVFQDWHNTLQCIGNSSASLCGAIDGAIDPGTVEGDPWIAFAKGLVDETNGRVFYEFVRPLDSPGATSTPKEDLAKTAGDVGIRVVLTQGQGGGKGGFVFPDPQTSTEKYHTISLD
jgi:hypothetical protein